MKASIVTLAAGIGFVPPTVLSDSPNAGGLPALEARVAALEAAGVPAPSEITVVCPGDSLADAVARGAPGVPLTVTVTGVCEEPLVEVTRDDVTIVGATREDGLVGALRIVGARRVSVRNLTVSNLDGTAINVTEGASATLEDVTAVGDLQSAPNSGNDGYGVLITRQAFALLTRVDALVLSGGNNALALSDGGTARTRDGSFVSQSDTSFDNAAIGLYRQASLRMDGAPIVENDNDLDASVPVRKVAIQVFHTSNFRLHSEVAAIRGTVWAGNNSALRIQRLGGPSAGPGLLDGSVLIDADSHVEIGTRSSAHVTGSVVVNDQSLLTANGPGAGAVTVDGGVVCGGFDPDGGIRNPDAVTPIPEDAGCNLF